MTAGPRQLVFVTGTGTEVGKTWFGAGTLAALHEQGTLVGARKPVQSFAPGGAPTDAEVLGAVTGERADTVCPRHRWYALPMAPPWAADALGAPQYTLADLVAELAWPHPVDVGVVEGAGGPRSPLAHDGDNAAFAASLRPDLVVLVTDAGLGTINAVRLALGALADFEVVVACNRFDPRDDLHRRNRDWLVDHDGLEVVTSPRSLAARLCPAPAPPSTTL